MDIINLDGSYVNVNSVRNYKGSKVIIQNQAQSLIWVWLSDNDIPPTTAQGLMISSGDIEEISIETTYFYVYGPSGSVVVNFKKKQSKFTSN